MSDFGASDRPTAPANRGTVPRFGMYAGPNYAGGHVLRAGELPYAAVWRVPPVGYLDDVTRNHDINYTYIEQTYTGVDAASRDAKTQAFWQADKEMLAGMLGYQPANWLEAQYRSAAIQAFVAKADMGYRPAVDVVGDWNRELAGIDPKFPAMEANEQGRARWNLPGLVHAGSTYTSTGMEALSTSGVNSQVAVLFNAHIQPGNIAEQKVNTHGELYDPLAERDFSRRLMIPQRDPKDASVFNAEGNIFGQTVGIRYHAGDDRLVRTVSRNGQIESQTTYQGVQAVGPAGERYKHADFTVTQQNYKDGQPDGGPVSLPPVNAAATPDIAQQQSAHTRDIKLEVLKGKDAQFPKAPTEADKAWHSGSRAETLQSPPQPQTQPQPQSQSQLQTSSHRTVPVTAPVSATATTPVAAAERSDVSSLSPLSSGAQRLLSDSERHVRALGDKHHLPWDRGMDNTVAAVARHAQASGLSQIDHLSVKDGQIRYATRDGAFIKEGALAARQAANVPAEQSMEALARGGGRSTSVPEVHGAALSSAAQIELPVVAKARA